MIAWWLALAVPSAEAGKSTKIEKALAAFEAGEAEALADALERIPKALDKAPDDPAVLVAVGRVYLAAGIEPGGGGVDQPLTQALGMFEKAATAGAAGEPRAALEKAVPALVSTFVADLTNLVESKQWADAKPAVELAQRSLALEASLGLVDAVRTGSAEKLATRVACATGDVAGAQAHYAKFAEASGGDDTVLAALVARKTAEGGDVPGAITFLSPIAAKANTDEPLLRVQMDLWQQANQPDAALARLDAIAAEMTGSISGAYLIGQLYQQLGAEEKARTAFESVLGRDPNHTDAGTALGRSWMGTYVRKKAELEGEGAARRPSKETKALQALLATAIAEADKRATAAVASGPTSIPAHELLLAVAEAQLARMPAKPRSKEKAAVQAAKDRVAAATTQLEELKREAEGGGASP